MLVPIAKGSPIKHRRPLKPIRQGDDATGALECNSGGCTTIDNGPTRLWTI